MKNVIPTLLATIFFSACSHYDDPELKPLLDKTYSGNSLTLYYNGEEMPNKSVKLSQNGSVASAEFFSQFDLAQLSAFGFSGSIPAPGVFPGDQTSLLSLDMKPSGEYWNFYGSGQTNTCTFIYKGYADEEKMAMFLSDVKFKTPGISPSVWQPAPLKNEDGSFSSLPFFINWQYDPLPGVDFDLTPYLEALATLPIIPVYNNTAYMSVSQAVSLMLQSVAFKDDGNLIVTYISSLGGATRIAQTLPNRFMYLPLSSDKVNLYLDPTALFGMMLLAGSTGVPSEDVKIIGNGIYPSGHVTETSPGVMESILKSEIGKKFAKAALSVILPHLADGLTFEVSESDGQMQFCFDNDIAMEMIGQIVTPLLEDDEAVKAMIGYIEGNASLKPLLPLLSKAIQLLPEALEKTNQLRIGLALVPYN